MLLLRGARQLVTVRGSESPRRGARLRELGVIRDGSVLIREDKIEEIGRTQRIANLGKTKGARVIDVSGKVVIPGLIDAFTHLAFARPRMDLFERRVAGATPTRDRPQGPAGSIGVASSAELSRRSERWLRMAASYGETAAEVRARQGVDASKIQKELRAIQALDRRPIELLGAVTASLPPGRSERSGDDRRTMLESLLENVGRKKLAPTFDLDCTFAEPSPETVYSVLSAAQRLGFRVKVEASRRRPGSCIASAIAAGATSVDHAVHLNERDVDVIADSSCVATLLPCFAFDDGRGDLPPARRLIDNGAAVALASGFGAADGASLSMPLVLSLACRQMRMMPEEAIAAATINAAYAIGCSDRLGSLEPGKQADLAVFDVDDYREIPYYLGLNLCVLTIRAGRMIFPYRLPAQSAGDEQGEQPQDEMR